MDSWQISKAIIFILIRGLLLFGSVAAGLTLGALTFALYRAGGNEAVAPWAGLVSGVSAYTAGLAGRHHVTTAYLMKLLPPKREEEKQSL